ncbi:Leucine-rich repeat receptor-like serine threonine tyrosine-protein kinase [Stylosanthes scabra]|uniref:Leucine-rich repeat receptor-like serine threonine tyrosine-protein kinase n=1 Tax=Stylosanthes scabra TaxID=79078 RepID=A0ABU6TTC4_9FABA|nr:Leucine-rich repeat receptor-like serine threonine tyrosine-protein kinase [Stylosanthes scabra]
MLDSHSYSLKDKIKKKVLGWVLGALVVATLAVPIFGFILHFINKKDLAFLKREDCLENLECIGRGGAGEVYKNGNLEDFLKRDQKGRNKLDWLLRYKISIWVGVGLEYLHINYRPRIIHQDLKSGNILLDDDMEARIADFDLAMAMPDDQSQVVLSNVGDIIGYIAPKYYTMGVFNDKCDIYSFSVMLGVSVTGKFSLGEFFCQECAISLVHWMRNITSENLNVVIDPILVGNGFENRMFCVLRIGSLCTRGVHGPDRLKAWPRPNEIWVIFCLASKWSELGPKSIKQTQ